MGINGEKKSLQKQCWTNCCYETDSNINFMNASKQIISIEDSPFSIVHSEY